LKCFVFLYDLMTVIGDKNIKELTGKVVSDKMEKTIVVSVPTVKVHPLYKKRFTRHKRYYAHDEQETAHEGDTVKIRADRPRSKKKRRIIVDIIQKAPS